MPQGVAISVRPGKAVRNLHTPFKPFAHDKIRRAGRVIVVIYETEFFRL